MTRNTTREDDYIRGILNGDSGLIKTIYEKYEQSIVHLVETDGGSLEDAKDVFQEGLMLVYQKAQQTDFQLSSSFFTYFYAVCRNIWRNKRKKKSNSNITLTEEMKSIMEDTAAPEIEANEQYVLYRKKFLLLGKDCQELLSLFFQKVSMEKIQEQMKFSSANYVKQKKFQCKSKLVKLIEQDPAYKELIN